MDNQDLIIRDGEADTAEIVDYELTRRDAMHRGLVTGGAVIGATSIPFLLGVRNAFAQADDDPGILEAAITLEHRAIVTYDSLAKGDALSGDLRRTAEEFALQEQEHADILTAALEDLGGNAPQLPEPAEIEGLEDLKSKKDALNFAIEVENMAIVAYDDAATKLTSAELLKTGAEIVSNEAQHLVVLRQALRANPIPAAFEAGQSK